MATGHKTGGRRRGSLNRLTVAFKDAVQTVYTKIGGDEAFAQWAKANPGEFYKIASRLIPSELNRAEKGGVTVIIARNERVSPPVAGDSRRLLA